MASGDLRLTNTNIFSSDWVDLDMSSCKIFPLLLFLSICAALIQTLPNYISYWNTFCFGKVQSSLTHTFQMLLKILPVTFTMDIFSSFTSHGVSSSNVSDLQTLSSPCFKVVYIGVFPSQQGVATFSWLVGGDGSCSPFDKFQNECLFGRTFLMLS